MTIATLNDYIGAAKQPMSIFRSGARTTVAGVWFQTLDLAGNPGAGTLAGTSTTAGVVPTDATAGCPTINAFGGGATGYLSQFEFGSTVACRMRLFDMLFKAGAYAFNANTALTAQPSYSSRVPGGTDYTDTQIWIEAVTAFTGNLTVTITYTNQSGVGGRTATLAVGAAMIVGRMAQVPLQAGDTGVQKIDNVAGSVATVGTFNALVLRPLATGRCKIANDGDIYDFARLGSPIVYADSALMLAIAADSTASGVPEIEFVIANK